MAAAVASIQQPVLHHDALEPVLSLNSPLKFPSSLKKKQWNESPGSSPSIITNEAETSPEIHHLLVSSPYMSRDHLLDLRPLETYQSLLSRALTILQPVDEHYATRPYDVAFNWPTVVKQLGSLARSGDYKWESHFFYIVVFRSQLPPTTDRTKLGELDEKSHVEANKGGGLLKYWFGIPNAEGRNLATCVWRDFKDARPASSGEGHKAAARATIQMYTEWKIERLRLMIDDDGVGGVGTWSIRPWEE